MTYSSPVSAAPAAGGLATSIITRRSTRLFPLSATYRLPWPSTTTPLWSKNWPGLRPVEHTALARGGARRILVDRRTVGRELDHSPVVGIRDVHVAVAIDRNSAGQVDLARAVAVGAKLPERSAVRRELLDAVVAPVRDIDVALAVEGNRLGHVELAGAFALGAEDLLNLAVRTVARHRIGRLVQHVDVVAGAVDRDADGRDHPARLIDAVAALPDCQLPARLDESLRTWCSPDRRRTACHPERPRPQPRRRCPRHAQACSGADLLTVGVVLDDLIRYRVDDKEVAAVIQSDLEHWGRIGGDVLPLGFEVKPVLRSGPTGAAQIVGGAGLESTGLRQRLGSHRSGKHQGQCGRGEKSGCEAKRARAQ